MLRRRIMLLALVALAVPFPALALDGGGTGPGTQTLSVSASLDQCGLAGDQILCKIDAGWNSIEGAERYAISVTSADGSVVDYGETGGQASSVWVPYVGPGSYSIQITAWGTPPEEEDGAQQQVLAKSEAMSGEIDTEAQTAPAEMDDEGEGQTVAPPGEVTDDPVETLPEAPPEVEPPCVEEPEEVGTAPPPQAPEAGEESSTEVPPDADTIPDDDDDCDG